MADKIGTDEYGEILIYQTDDGQTNIEVKIEDDTVWLTQQQLTELYQCSKSNISEHIKHIFEEGELDKDSVVRKFRTTADDGKTYNVTYYNLDMIISLGYRIKSVIATRFRQWATKRLKEYMIKGFTIDDERLKGNGGGNYWKELLDRIRDIRSSEKVLYRQVLDLYATSVDYKDYLLNDGIHEAIISEEMWNQAHRKRQETGVLQIKTHSLEHEHILSGIIKCPVCGSGMYGNVNRKKHPDGGYYKDYFYYACKHRKLVGGHRCTYKRQWNEDRINAAVEEIIRKFVTNSKFEEEIRKQIGGSIDTSELDREYDGLKDRLNQTTGAKNKLADQMDHLSVSDKNYDKKYNDMQERLDRLYDEITDIENAMEEVTTRIYNIKQDKISEDNVYQFLLFFDKLYDKFTDLEKKTFLKSFLSDVFIYEEEQKDGRILRGLRFKFPIYLNGRDVLGVDWDNESTDETVCLLRQVDS